MMQDLQEKYPDAELQIELARNIPGGLLTEQRFWELIGLLDWSKEGNDEAVLEPLVAALAAGPMRHIYEFEDLLSQKLYALDGIIYARNIGQSAYRDGAYFSPDIFLYARCCAVANGRETYEQVLKNSEIMPKDIDFGALLRASQEAFKRKTGRNLDYIPAYPIETYSNHAGWQEA